MAFKLRSGNKSSYKQLGSEETTEQYNARVRAEYEAKLQAHSDSTAAYNQALVVDDLYNKGQRIKDKSTKTMLDKMEELKQRQDYYEKNRHKFTARWQDGKHNYISTKGEEFVYPGYDDPGCGRGFVADASGKCVEQLKVGSKIIKEGKTLEKELKKGGIYPTEKRRLEKRAEGEYYYAPRAGQVKPGDEPREPVEMIGIDIKNIDMGQVDTETPDLPKRSKYMISEDKKWRFNLDTGEWTKREKPQKRKEQKPRRRKTRNLVTGKWNITKRKTGTTQ